MRTRLTGDGHYFAFRSIATVRERPDNEPRTCGFQRAMTQTQFKIEFERKIGEVLFPRFSRSVRYGERAILLDSIFAFGIAKYRKPALSDARLTPVNEILGYNN